MTTSETATSGENTNLAQKYVQNGGSVTIIRGFVEVVREVFGVHSNLSEKVQGALVQFNQDITNIASANDAHIKDEETPKRA